MKYYLILLAVLAFLCAGCVHRDHAVLRSHCCGCGASPVFPRLHERLSGEACSAPRAGLLERIRERRAGGVDGCGCP